MVPRFQPGEQIEVVEQWRGLLWSASARIVVEDTPTRLVEWMPAGSPVHSSTSRGIPEREDLSITDRQLESLDTCRWNYRRVEARASKLNFLTRDGCSRVELTWLPDGTFLHWYVNFQRPMRRAEHGYETMDLVVDIVVAPDLSWEWKDRDGFERAIERGIFDAEVAGPVIAESSGILRQLADREGAFEPRWQSWSPPDAWGIPSLRTAFPHGLETPVGAAVDESLL